MSEEPVVHTTPASKLGAVLAHIAAHGHLHAFLMSPLEKQVLMRAAIEQGHVPRNFKGTI
jgi:hypothetical protein